MSPSAQPNFSFVDGLPVLVLSSATPTQAYKEAVLLRRRAPVEKPVASSVWLAFLDEANLRNYDGDALIRALELARIDILGFVGSEAPTRLMSKATGMPRLIASITSSGAVHFASEDDGLESWILAPFARKANAPACADLEDNAPVGQFVAHQQESGGMPIMSTAFSLSLGSAVESSEVSLLEAPSFPPSSEWSLETVSIPGPDMAVDRASRAIESEIVSLGISGDVSAVADESEGVSSVVAPEEVEQSLTPGSLDEAEGFAVNEDRDSGEGIALQNVSSDDTPLAVALLPVADRMSRIPNRIHSGQVFEAEGDVVALNNIGCGGEVVAGGSIYAYGPLLGRVFAGAFGDETARIYASNFRPELVSIAGRFTVFEEIPEDLLGRSVEIWLENDVLRFALIGGA